mgnify:CR=1 FL=1
MFKYSFLAISLINSSCFKQHFVQNIVYLSFSGCKSSNPPKTENWKCINETSTGGCGPCGEKCCRESQNTATGEKRWSVVVVVFFFCDDEESKIIFHSYG